MGCPNISGQSADCIIVKALQILKQFAFINGTDQQATINALKIGATSFCSRSAKAL
jgi:hypothetical protein